MTTVTLLTQQSCTFCDQAKDVLARLATEHDLDIAEVSLDTDAGRELGLRHGVLFAPGVLLDDRLFSYGRLSERKLRRELKRHHQRQADDLPDRKSGIAAAVDRNDAAR